MASTFQTMRAYRTAYFQLQVLKQKREALIKEADSMVTPIAQAQAAENKAREAMLLAVQQNENEKLKG